MKRTFFLVCVIPLCAMQSNPSFHNKQSKKKHSHFSSEEKRSCEQKKVEQLEKLIALTKQNVELKQQELKLRELELEFLQRQTELLKIQETISILSLITQYQAYRAQVDPSASQFQDEKIIRELLYRCLGRSLPSNLSWVRKEAAAQKQAQAAKSNSNSLHDETKKGG